MSVMIFGARAAVSRLLLIHRDRLESTGGGPVEGSGHRVFPCESSCVLDQFVNGAGPVRTTEVTVDFSKEWRLAKTIYKER